MKGKLRRISLLIAFLGSTAVVIGSIFGWFDYFENKSLDLRFQFRGSQKSIAPVVIAAIDDEALQTVGKWPWPRRIHGRILDICRKAGASAVVFDVLFLEPDRYDPSNDRAMGQAMKKNGRAVSAFNFKLTEESVVEESAVGEKSEAKAMDIVLKEDPIEEIVRSAKVLGFVNTWQDSDGYLRRAYLSFDYDGQMFYPLSVQAVAIASQRSAEEVLQGLPITVAQVWGKYSVQDALINWRGPEQDTFDTYSCAQILDSSLPDEWKYKWLKDKIVMIGSTALGLYDHYPTPFSPQLPGLYKHANIADNLITKQFLTPVTGWVSIFLIFAFGLGSGFFVPRTNIWIGVVSMFATGALFAFLGYLLMARKLIYIEMAAPTFSLLGNYMFVFFYRFIVEQREKAGIKKAFGVYVNPHVVDEIAKNPDGLKLGGEMREMTVMFSDVAGFTSVSEKLTPSELVHLLNLYLTAMTDTIMRHDGTVDKYEGDAIMAFWGAPLVQPIHAKLGCLTVLENRKRLTELNVELKKQGLNELFARCGLNTGPMNVGNMGSTQKFNYTVMGDAVNLASRLEGANKQYGTALMVSESTYEQAKDDIEVRELDLLRVKGKKLPIRVFELACIKGELSETQKRGFDLYNEGLRLYRERNFKEALKQFVQVKEFLVDDGPSGTYIERSENYIESPPAEDWDGVFTMTTK